MSAARGFTEEVFGPGVSAPAVDAHPSKGNGRDPDPWPFLTSAAFLF